MNREIVLIDLSSLAHPIWHTSQGNPDPNATSQQIVARVRSLASEKPYAAICCDSGKSFRHELSPAYKANRPQQEASLHHQIGLAKEVLEGDGFPIWSVAGFEADDLIATAVRLALEAGDTATIVSADKDLLQLVGDRVRAVSARDGSVFDSHAVWVKFAVQPEQMCDYLCLVGDASDNVKGCNKVGPKNAADLLKKYGSITGIYEALHRTPTAFTPALATNLREFEDRVEDVRGLIRLRDDVEIPFNDLFADRVPKEVASFGDFGNEDDMDTPEATAAEQPPEAAVPPAPAASALAVRDAEILPAPKEWERGLDPRSQKEAITLAKHVHESRLFSAYGTPQGVLTTIILGRELGMPAMASLRGIHIIEGRHGLAAQTMVALILKSGLAEYFEPVEFDEVHAIYETKRVGARNPIRMTHTIEMARTAGLVKPDSNWAKVPTDMLVSRASSRLARMVYPDLIGGLYTPEELREIRNEVAA